MNKHLLFAALACIGIAPAHADLIVDGGFEALQIANDSYTTVTSLTGWTGTPNIEIQNHIAGTPYEGNNLVELDTDANSGMYQDFASVAGQNYQITFEYSPRPGIALSSTGIELLWNGVVVGTVAQSGIGLGDTVWTQFTFDEVATGSLSRIGFAATGTSDSFGGYLDDVAAVAVPEPATWSLLGAVLTMTVFAARRRRKA